MKKINIVGKEDGLVQFANLTFVVNANHQLLLYVLSDNQLKTIMGIHLGGQQTNLDIMMENILAQIVTKAKNVMMEDLAA